MSLTLTELILLSLLVVAISWLFYKLADKLDECSRPTDKEIEEMLKRAEDEFNNRPRVRAITD